MQSEEIHEAYERAQNRTIEYDITSTSRPHQFAEANGIRFAYRRFGQEGGTPLLFMQHFRGGMDHWDPAATDGFAKNRPVILFDNAGVASSSARRRTRSMRWRSTPPISSAALGTFAD